ncbi:MAG: hypothetical protein NVSMB60_27840 [Mycobacterium sp.]
MATVVPVWPDPDAEFVTRLTLVLLAPIDPVPPPVVTIDVWLLLSTETSPLPVAPTLPVLAHTAEPATPPVPGAHAPPLVAVIDV